MQVVMDSSVLVGLVNHHDHWHKQSMALYQDILVAKWEIVYLDCVISESVSAVIRRLHEKKQFNHIQYVFQKLNRYAMTDNITWVFPEVPSLYNDVIKLIQSSNGTLNFNDALIALICQKRKISFIASFDTDFDQITWLKRVAISNDIKNNHSEKVNSE
ncbi:MAG: hypothetical protein B6242_03760 [Anaerolineaceae bacterium 4572_78]|nr:MAG: hypothetical protein B6242_03760 [Anaerolineaceae bacterium 4572_78]